jgi:penicillin-binding protein 2
MEFRFPEDERSENSRITILQIVIAAAFLGLLIGYWRLQIGQHRQYLEAAERNRIRNLPVTAPRGRILDREGRVLADNFPAFQVLLVREGLENLTPPRVAGIANGLGIQPDDILQELDRASRLPRFQPIVLKNSAAMEDIAFVEAHRWEYPELDLLQVHQRSYPRRTIASSVLGYVGEVSEEALARPGSPHRMGDVIGKSGIESSYDRVLAGRNGMRRVVVNSRGQEMGSMTTIDAVVGNDLRLTLDLDIQTAAEAALGGQTGAIVALDPATGEILAMVSHPSFDPEAFARGIDSDTWKQLNTDPGKPLLNKAIQAHLAPGSVFKIVTGAAALETGTIRPDFTLNCKGAVTLYGHTFRDWTFSKGHGHGSVDLHRAIVHSCDVYFYTLGKMLGIEKIALFAKGLGLGARTGIDLPSEDSGLVPSPEWARKAQKRQWWAGETISVAIGQGAVAVTPLQLAYMIGGVLSGGVLQQPHLAFRDQLRVLNVAEDSETLRQFPLNAKTVELLSGGMRGVVNEGGTGAGAFEPGLDMGGKTGTAQVVSMKLRESAKKAEYRSNAWFVGYSPTDKPEIVVCALVLQGEHSALAVPMVRDVIKAYLAKNPLRRPKDDQLQTQIRVLSEVRRSDPEPRSAGGR